ncbi:mycothione reductase [Oryzobacter terrae]|uniref:mycothione reductase n=1 Tax=Oryzobacter terrae TaxID=1620385 RepID=UPI00366AB24C
MPHHDLVIIGSGSGNSLLTPELDGLDVAIVEKGTFGGTCLNVGCIPTKMFVVPADRVLEAHDAHRLGVTFAPPTVDWPAIRDRIFGRIDPISAGGEAYRDSQEHVTLYRTRARFSGDRRLALDTGEEVTADRVVVASGSRPNGLDVEGLRQAGPDRGVHTSDTVMRLDALPARMAVVGGGFVACEMAHVFSALGVHVTQVQRSATLLTHEETEIAQRYTEVARHHYDVRLHTTVSSAEHTAGVWRLATEGPGGPAHVEAEVVLLAVGRRPNTDLLDPAAGGLETSDDDLLVVDDQLRTTAPGVWALGDICSTHQLKHVANHEARIVAHNLAVDTGRLEAAPLVVDDRPVPHAVFGHPQVASFGPTAAQLDEAGTRFVTKTQAFGDVAYGWALEDTTGLLTVHASPDGTILAAHALGPHASTVIQPLIQAASFGQHATEVARGQYWIHPALAEVVENALLGLPLDD